jgi:F0F1-type ATP synthase assembly protein I
VLQQSSDICYSMGKMKTTAVSSTSGKTPTTTKSEVPNKGRSAFFALAIDMSWKLALVILGPIIGGTYLDNALETAPLFTVIGLLMAVVGSIAVMWQVVKVANRQPVPKLTEAQRRQIREEYEKDDEDA